MILYTPWLSPHQPALRVVSAAVPGRVPVDADAVTGCELECLRRAWAMPPLARLQRGSWMVVPLRAGPPQLFLHALSRIPAPSEKIRELTELREDNNLLLTLPPASPG